MALTEKGAQLLAVLEQKKAAEARSRHEKMLAEAQEYAAGRIEYLFKECEREELNTTVHLLYLESMTPTEEEAMRIGALSDQLGVEIGMIMISESNHSDTKPYVISIELSELLEMLKSNK